MKDATEGYQAATMALERLAGKFTGPKDARTTGEKSSGKEGGRAQRDLT